MSRVLRELSVTALPRAECQDCDWTWYESRLTREEAKAHARNHIGHRVVVVVEKRDLWMRKEE